MAEENVPRRGLPGDFLWGFATAAYQIEGAVDADGRGPSIWDTFCKIPGKIADGSSGDVACNSYNRTADDISLLKQTGAKAYRFSISWSRIIPLGGRNDPVNPAGIKHYQKFVDDLLDAGIIPFVTLFHWDLPAGLDERYGGFLNQDEFVRDFAHYARVMYEALPKVKHWITFNEPICSAILGYHSGDFAPGHTSNRSKSPVGSSSTEPWIVAHSILIAHAEAVKIYRDGFKSQSGGQIGITLNGDWAEPWDADDPEDIKACERRLEFFMSWFADPIYFGHYPQSMIDQLGNRLPTFTPEQSTRVKGSNDFFGFNHYTTNYIKHKQPASNPPLDDDDDDDCSGRVEILQHDKAGRPIGPETQSPWLRPYAPGFRKLLNWLSNRYGRPAFYVTENGTSIKGESKLSLSANPQGQTILQDDFRVQYFRDYITALAEAVAEDGVDSMATTDILPYLDHLEDNLDALEESLNAFLPGQSVAATAKTLPLVDRAKLHVTVAYAIESLIFSYLRLHNLSPHAHPVFKELARVKSYFDKIKEIENKNAPSAGAGSASSGGGGKPDVALDKSAAERTQGISAFDPPRPHISNTLRTHALRHHDFIRIPKQRYPVLSRHVLQHRDSPLTFARNLCQPLPYQRLVPGGRPVGRAGIPDSREHLLQLLLREHVPPRGDFGTIAHS
ncbi:hypothetical protein DV738_g2440, partial [Chaetothyriales sp. CBS 135597]